MIAQADLAEQASTIPGNVLIAAIVAGLVALGVPKLLQQRQEFRERRETSALGMASEAMASAFDLASKTSESTTQMIATMSRISADLGAVTTVLNSIESRLAAIEARQSLGADPAPVVEVERQRVPPLTGDDMDRIIAGS